MPVHNSTADGRYLARPRQLAGTESWSENHLTQIISRDSPVGVILPDPAAG